MMKHIQLCRVHEGVANIFFHNHVRLVIKVGGVLLCFLFHAAMCSCAFGFHAPKSTRDLGFQVLSLNIKKNCWAYGGVLSVGGVK